MMGALVAVTYVDDQGRKWWVLVPQGTGEDQIPMGIPVGPPDFTGLGLPEAITTRLHNELFDRGVITTADLRGRSQEIASAIAAAMRVDVTTIVGLYKGKDLA